MKHAPLEGREGRRASAQLDRYGAACVGTRPGAAARMVR